MTGGTPISGNLHMEVSWNRGTPKSSILMWFSIHPATVVHPHLWKQPYGLTMLTDPPAGADFQHAPLAPWHWGPSAVRTVDVPLQVLCGDETAATSALERIPEALRQAWHTWILQVAIENGILYIVFTWSFEYFYKCLGYLEGLGIQI